jgi:hypothetical protein
VQEPARWTVPIGCNAMRTSESRTRRRTVVGASLAGAVGLTPGSAKAEPSKPLVVADPSGDANFLNGHPALDRGTPLPVQADAGLDVVETVLSVDRNRRGAPVALRLAVLTSAPPGPRTAFFLTAGSAGCQVRLARLADDARVVGLAERDCPDGTSTETGLVLSPRPDRKQGFVAVLAMTLSPVPAGSVLESPTVTSHALVGQTNGPRRASSPADVVPSTATFVVR